MQLTRYHWYITTILSSLESDLKFVCWFKQEPSYYFRFLTLAFFNSILLVKTAVCYLIRQLIRHKYSPKDVSIATFRRYLWIYFISICFLIDTVGRLLQVFIPVCTGLTSRNLVLIQVIHWLLNTALRVQDKNQNIYLFNITHIRQFTSLSNLRHPSFCNSTGSTHFCLTFPLIWDSRKGFLHRVRNTENSCFHLFFSFRVLVD